MDTFLRIDINIAAIVLLGAVCITARSSLDRKDAINRLFLRVSLIILLELVFETLTCIINRRPELWLVPVSNFFHICLFTTAPLLTYCWFTFTKNLMVSCKKHSLKKDIILLLPAVINAILTFLSPIFKYVFYVDNLNVYHRGQFFYVSAAITYYYLLLGFFLVIKKRKKIVKHEFIPIMIIGILPSIGGLLQSLFYGMLLMWSCSAFSLVLVYNFLQQRMIHIDNLTGAWTKGSFDFYISRKIKQIDRESFGAIYIDFDNLKEINDKYGHIEGDYALKTFTEIIRSVLRKSDIIARTGGDEFIIIMDCESDEVLEKTVERINNSLLTYNKNSIKEYILGCSSGYDIFDEGFKDIEQFLCHVDNLMYINKKLKRKR